MFVYMNDVNLKVRRLCGADEELQTIIRLKTDRTIPTD